MAIYLHDIPLSDALSRLEDELIKIGRWGVLGIEEKKLDENVVDRVLGRSVIAKISSPHYHAAAMDGFAVRSRDTEGAIATSPKTLTYGSQASYVDTGDPMPSWADSVVPIEYVEALNVNGAPSSDPRHPASIRIRSAVPPWMHVRPLGEDMVATQLVLPEGHVLRPIDLGAIAGCGYDRVHVTRKPRVAIIPTGTELVPVGSPVKAGDIIEYNSLVMAAQVNAWGGEATRYPITADDFESIKERVIEAAHNSDLILLNAGSSAGSEDYSAEVISSLGEVFVHGVAVRPGHPVILGVLHPPNVENFLPIIGVPGYPVSAAMTGEIFVEPIVARWLGRLKTEYMELKAKLTRKTTSPPGDDDYVRVAIGKVGDKMLAAPLTRGAGVITSLVRADGIVIIPKGSQGLPAGEEVTVRMYRTPNEIERTILSIGSHDMTLDVLAQFLVPRRRRLTSANVGSLGGLIALRRGEAHLAGIHLLDPDRGEYNLPYLEKYLPGISVQLISFVGREQGIIVQKNNPKKINSLEDLIRSEVRFINRQRGAGTRILLDYHLNKMGIVSESIEGYEQEEYTHLTVAAAVVSGRADCGLGIAAAAEALELDFIPLYKEKYDLVIPHQHAHSHLLAPLYEILNDNEFRQTVTRMPGYDVANMGDIVIIRG